MKRGITEEQMRSFMLVLNRVQSRIVAKYGMQALVDWREERLSRPRGDFW